MAKALAAIDLSLSSMSRGQEMAHLLELLRHADYKGSDVNLATQVLTDGCRQPTPYPTFAWEWKSVQSYSWQAQQHINVLEFIAFFNYIRSQVGSCNFHSKRFFHVFDSKVVSCVVAKGRSSSRVLNRVCRRYAAYALAADLYVCTLWTISSWNHSDAGSRQLVGDHG